MVSGHESATQGEHATSVVAERRPTVYTVVYTREDSMKTARVFRSGNSQAVRIPKEFRIEGDEVEILKKGRSLVLRPRRRSWTSLVRSLDRFTGDFMAAGRHQGRLQTRGRAFS